jgi:hypothetical protein
VFGQPKLSVVGGLKFDLGELYTTKVVAKNLTLKNVGTETLTISDVSATCGCTGTLMSSDRLAPGESGTLSITFNPKNIKGAVEKAVSMDTNDSTQSHVRITFTAKIVPVIELDRDYIVYRTTMDSIVSDSFTITNSSATTIHILSVTPMVDGVSATLSSDKLKAGESATVTCSFSPKKNGTTKGNIAITTDHPNAPSLDVRFYGWVGSKKSSGASTNQN